MDVRDAITASMLSEELGVSNATAAKILKEVGGEVKVGNATLYPRSYVQVHLFDKYSKLLKFLAIEEYYLSGGDNDNAQPSEVE